MMHEKYQSHEEIQSEKVRKENQEQVVNKIHKRSAPEIIKFELSDARTNYANTHQSRNAQRGAKVLQLHQSSSAAQQHSPPSIKPLAKQLKKDMSAQESIMVKITHPVTATKSENRIRVMNKQLPIGVQNMINLLVLNNNSPKDSKSKPMFAYNVHQETDGTRYAANNQPPETAYNRYQYQTGDDHFWELFSKNRPKRVFTRPQTTVAPIVASPQHLTNYIAYPNYILPYQSLEVKPIENKYLQSVYPHVQLNKVITSKLPNIDQEFSSKFYYPTNGIVVNFADKSQQFRSGGELQQLVAVHPQAIESEFGKNSTAPILFPLDARLPKTTIIQNKTLVFGTSIVHPSPVPDVKIESVAGGANTDLTNFLKENGEYAPAKDHTPIIEFPDEMKEARRPTPPPKIPENSGFPPHQNPNEVGVYDV